MHGPRLRHETPPILDDVLLAIMVLVGSLPFLRDRTAPAGTWLFLIGSVRMLPGPSIRSARRVHLGRINPRGAHESSMDV